MKKRLLLLFTLITTMIVGCDKTSSSIATSSEKQSSSETVSSVTSIADGSSTSVQSSSVSVSSVTSVQSSSSSISIPAVNDSYKGNYYNSISDSMTGSTLQDNLKKLITNGHKSRGYDALWDAYKTTDVRPGTNNIVWDMYSNCSYNVSRDHGGSYSGEGDMFNREHSIPQSWFNKSNPMVCDVHHIYPTDGYVNNRRSNYPYGEVGKATYTSKNGSKLGSSSFSGYSGTVFEPIDEYKGDFARTYFYFATRYQGVATSGAGQNVFRNSYPYLTTYAINLFTKWSQMDPVSQKEIDRNNACYAFQGNRNPFIDKPSYIAKIFGVYGGSLPSNPGGNTSQEQNTSYEICKPVVGETYKLGFFQESLNETMWIDGTYNDATPWYLKTTTNYNDAVNVTIEEASSGYYLSVTISGQKKYINMVKNGDHKNLSIDDTKSTIYTYDDTYKTFVSSLDGEKRYLGTYNTYTTLSCSSYSHISTSYPSHFYKQK